MTINNRLPRVAAVNDISGFGRCSLTTCMPVLSVMGIQCCPVPTSVLSMHTGFENFEFTDMTDFLPRYLESWERQGLTFDAVYSGFLGSYEQIRITEGFMKRQNGALLVVDPVMGDDGRLYTTLDDRMKHEMKKLVSLAHIVTPNVTEACFLAGETYKRDCIDDDFARLLCEKISSIGTKAVVITGIRESENQIKCCYYENGQFGSHSYLRSSGEFSGNGDLFASLLTGFLLKGLPLVEAIKRSTDFIYRAIEYTLSLNVPLTDGIAFESLLHTLYFKD